MGQFNYDNIVVDIFLRDNISDRRFDCIESLRPSMQEYEAIEKNLCAQHPVSSMKAEELIRFFISYENGWIKPDKWNYFEPVNKDFDETNITDPIRALAFPGGELYLKKKKICDIVIKNHTFPFIWEDSLFLPATAPLPEYLTTISIYFPIGKNVNLHSIINLMHSLKNAFSSDSGKIYYQKTGEIIAQ